MTASHEPAGRERRPDERASPDESELPDPGAPDETDDDPGATADDPGEDDEGNDGPVWYETRAGRAVVGTYLLGTLLGVVVAVQDPGSLPLVSTTGGSAVHPVPGYVFLYAFMGASAYAVTSLVSREKTTEEVVQLALRVVAALPLALGVWALAPLADFGGQDRVIAGVAFLAGLYVNLALKTFGSLAERLLTPPGE